MKKINFKQKKYILPLILLPFIFLITINLASLFEEEEIVEVKTEELNVSLNSDKTKASIKNKYDAYDEFYKSREGIEGRSFIEGVEKEEQEKEEIGSNFSEREKQIIDSLDVLRKQNEQELAALKANWNANEKKPVGYSNQKSNEELLDVLFNEESRKEDLKNKREEELLQQQSDEYNSIKEMEKSQMSLMRQQMMFLDSLEASKTPEAQRNLKAQQNLQRSKEQYEEFLNNTLSVKKSRSGEEFNTVYRTKGSTFIKAVVDENIKGYLGSRIRIRLLEDVFVGKLKINKGSFLYAQIAGFQLQRVDLSIISVMYQDEILPINLSIYDTDGMKGLYVPSSIFREMTKELGATAMQGQNLGTDTGSFYMATATKLFQSTSNALVSLMRKNKAKVKYNTFIYLVDEKEQSQKKNKIYN